jgi:Transposase DDE domain
MINIDTYHKGSVLLRASLLKMANIKKPQLKFFLTLFETFMTIPVRINFLMMGRFSNLDEKTFRLQFKKAFDFPALSTGLLSSKAGREMICALDPSFIDKSGDKTHGIAKFWNGKAQIAEEGLEIACLALVDVGERTAYHLCARQSEAPTKDNTLVGQYVKVVTDNLSHIKKYTGYLTADSYFMKKNFISPIMAVGLHVVTKMRTDGNLRHVLPPPAATGGKKRGRPNKYGKKVCLKAIDKDKWTLFLDTPETRGYEIEAFCMALKEVVRVVYLEKPATGHYSVLLSTDKGLCGAKILEYYQLRFQIEFLIRDAKQYCGLGDCQARDGKKLAFHFNMSLTSTTIAKLAYWSNLENKMEVPFSMHNIKQFFYNKHITENIIVKLGIDRTCDKIKNIIAECLYIGRIAA